MTTGYANRVFGLIATPNGHEVRSLAGEVYSRITGLPSSDSDMGLVARVIKEAPSVVPNGADLVPESVYESMVELGDVISVTAVIRNGARVSPSDSTKIIGASDLIREMACSDTPFEVTSSFHHERGLLRGKQGYEISNKSGSIAMQVNSINGSEPSMESIEKLVSRINLNNASPSEASPRSKKPSASRGPSL